MTCQPAEVLITACGFDLGPFQLLSDSFCGANGRQVRQPESLLVPRDWGFWPPVTVRRGRPRMRAVWGFMMEGGGRADMFRQSYLMSRMVLTQLPVFVNLQKPTGRKSHMGEYLRVHFMPHQPWKRSILWRFVRVCGRIRPCFEKWK